jgi:hypothetical protein
MHKKGKISRLKFLSNGVKHSNFKKLPIGKGKIMEIMKNVDFHMILPSIKIW